MSFGERLMSSEIGTAQGKEYAPRREGTSCRPGPGGGQRDPEVMDMDARLLSRRD